MPHQRPFLYTLLLLVAIGALSSTTSQAQDADAANHDFRVTITVFDAKEDEKLDEHLVVFDKSMVYDFGQAKDDSVVIFDLQRNRMIMLDRKTKVRSTVNTQDLTHLVAQIRASSDEKTQERLGMNAKAELLDEKYVVEFGKIHYATTTQAPTKPDIALAFGLFADWASRLNAARQRGLPPFARMELNQAIAKAGELPKEVELQVKRTLKTERFRSTYELIEQISEKDRKQIAEVGSMLTLYREVPMRSFPQ